MEKKRMIFRSLNILLLLVCCFGIKLISLAEEGKNGDETEILLVVDRSYSLRNEEESVKQSLELLYEWVEREALSNMVDVVAFADKAVRTELTDMDQVLLNRNRTSVVEGLNEANLWIEEKLEKGKKVSVIVISDLVESPGQICSIEEAERKQEKVDAIIKSWSDLRNEGALNYFFITWKDDENVNKNEESDEKVKTLTELKNDNIKEVDEFRYIIIDKNRVLSMDIQENAKAGEAVSKIIMTGKMIMEVSDMIIEVDIQKDKLEYLKINRPIELEEYHEAVMLLENGVNLISEEMQRRITPMYSTDSVQIFHLNMNIDGKKFQVVAQEGDQKEGSELYCFFTSVLSLNVHFSTVSKVEGEEFQLYCSTKNSYEEKWLVKPLKLTIYVNTGLKKEVVYEEILEFDEQKQCYTASICLEAAGIYPYEIKMANGKIITASELIVKTAKSK